MDLRLFFEPLNENIFDKLAPSDLGTDVFYRYDNLPKWKDIDIALIGVKERPNAEQAPADKVREQFYRLKKSSPGRLLDLGNLRAGQNTEETSARLREVCEFLISHNILPLIVGGSHALDFGQFTAYEGMEKMIYMLCVDARIDLSLSRNALPADNHLHDILMHRPNYLFGFGLLGYQSFLTESEHIEMFHRLNFDEVSVGKMRNRPEEIEPLIRTADMLSFDLSAIKKTDFPAGFRSGPFGLTAEEAGQICWYAGLNEKLSSFGIYEYDAEADTDGRSAMVIAVMIWYFTEGFYHRKESLNFKSNFHIRYVIPLNNEHDDLVFYKSRLTDRWWIELPLSDETGDNFDRKILVPCSYSDYEEASKGHIPDRWVAARRRRL